MAGLRIYWALSSGSLLLPLAIIGPKDANTPHVAQTLTFGHEAHSYARSDVHCSPYLFAENDRLEC